MNLFKMIAKTTVFVFMRQLSPVQMSYLPCQSLFHIQLKLSEVWNKIQNLQEIKSLYKEIWPLIKVKIKFMLIKWALIPMILVQETLNLNKYPSIFCVQLRPKKVQISGMLRVLEYLMINILDKKRVTNQCSSFMSQNK